MRGLLLLSLVVACACASSSPPSRPADIGGEITRVVEVSGGIQMLVEAIPGDRTGGAKASVTTDGRTAWFAGLPGGRVEPGGLGVARVGARVAVWFDGPAAMSYPVQARAAAVQVLTAR